jgi:serine protease Do
VRENLSLGAGVIEVDNIIARQFGLMHSGGVLVNHVVPRAAADKGGLERGDVIIRIDGRKIHDLKSMDSLLARKKTGDTVEFTIMRRGARKRVFVDVGQTGVPTAAPDIAMSAGPKEFDWMGAEFAPLDPALSMYEDGVKVGDVGGLLASAGITSGDIVKGVNGIPVTDMPSFMEIIKGVSKRKGFLLDVKRAGRPFYVVVK